MTLIEQAQSSIALIDGKLSDPGILALMDRRRAEGISVFVHDASRVGNLKVHGKIMLIDDARAVVGGLALTALSLDFRREVAITIDEPASVSQIRSLFRSLDVAGTSGDIPAATAGGAKC